MNNYDLAMQFPDEDTDIEMLSRKKVEKQNELNKLNDELSLLADYKTDYGWEDLLTQAKKIWQIIRNVSRRQKATRQARRRLLSTAINLQDMSSTRQNLSWKAPMPAKSTKQP